MSEIAIIIPNWNGEKWIKKCLDSIDAQNYKDYELLVVDNNSKDNSIEILKKYKDIKVISNNLNCGFATAIDIGVNNTNSKYILLLNNDTWMKPNFLEVAIKEIKDKKLSVLGFQEMDYFSEKLYDSEDKYYGLDIFGYHIKTNNVEKSFYLCGVCLLIERNCYINVGRFDRNFFMYMEEVDWFWRLNLMAIPFGLSDLVKIHHFRHGSSEKYGDLSASRFMWRNKNTLIMLLKNYSPITLMMVMPLYFLINLVEIIYFSFNGRFDIASTYPKAFIQSLSHFQHILSSRKHIKKQRLISDFKLMHKMYFGSAKFKSIIR